MTDSEKIIQLKQALKVAAKALSIAADWSVNEVQVYPPKEWNLEAYNEDPEQGWCSIRQLSQKLNALSQS